MFHDLFIAFSKKGFEWAKKVNPLVKIVKIPHGVNLEKFNPNVKPKKLDLERPMFITVSHLSPYKRVGESVKAVAKLGRGSLLVLGEGPEAEEVDRLGEQLLNSPSSRSRVCRGCGDLVANEIATPVESSPFPWSTSTRHGVGSTGQASKTPRNDGMRRRYLRLVVPYAEVPSYLTAADVFTLASAESEAFGLVYLEALACNLPVVATDDSLRRELIGDSGIFVENPRSSQEYSRALELAAKTDWGNKPLEQAKSFDWDRIVSRYLEEFRGI